MKHQLMWFQVNYTDSGKLVRCNVSKVDEDGDRTGKDYDITLKREEKNTEITESFVLSKISEQLGKEVTVYEKEAEDE